MTASETTASGSVLWAEPQLFVGDIARACAFCVEKLGFRIVFQHGEPAFYAQVARGGARLNLRHADRPAIDPALRALEGDVLSATVTVDQAEPLFLELRQRGATFHQTLRSESWGAHTFIVRDPDGNLILFAGN